MKNPRQTEGRRRNFTAVDFFIWPRRWGSPGGPTLRFGANLSARPVRLTVGSPPGGQIDIIARLTGQWLSERLGQPFIVDNRPGAGSNIGAEAVVRAPADGHMLFLASATNAINATLYDNLNFNFVRDTGPIASINRIPIVLKVHASFFGRTVTELVDHAKSNPGSSIWGRLRRGQVPIWPPSCLR